jgi:hypothetical protein
MLTTYLKTAPSRCRLLCCSPACYVLFYSLFSMPWCCFSAFPGMGAVYFFFDWLSKSFGLGGLNRYRQMML